MNENELLRAILGLCQQWVTNTSGSPPVNLTLPLIDDPVPTAREKLYLTDGTWDVPVTITYEWEIGGVLNPAETFDTYTTSDLDVGKAIRCKVTATSGSLSTSVFTAATAAVVSNATPVCVLKLYADEVLSSPVNLWTDYSGQSNNAEQNMAPNQPVLAAGPNGHMAVQFDGVDDIMIGVLGGTLTQATIFVVCRWRTTTDSEVVAGLGGNPGADELKTVATLSGRLIGFSGYGSDQASSTHPDTSKYYLVSTTAENGNVSLWINGTNAFSGAALSLLANAAGFFLGAFKDGTFPGATNIASFSAFTGLLSTGNRQACEAYLTAEFGPF